MIRFHLPLALLLAASAPAAQKETKGKKGTPAVVQGVKTPGVLIPFANLKSEASLALDAPLTGFLFTEMPLFANASGVHRFDPQANKPFDPPADIKVDKACGGMVNAFEHIWTTACGSKSIAKIKIEARGGGRGGRGGGPRPERAKPEGAKPEAPKPEMAKEMPDGPKPDRLTPAPVKPMPATVAGSVALEVAPTAPGALAASADSLWLLGDDKTNLLRIDPQQSAVVASLRLPAACASLIYADNALWVACPNEPKILKIDPKTNLVDKRIEVAKEPVALAFGDGSVWVLGKKEGKISRIDPKTNKVTATIDLAVPNVGGSLAYGEGALWVSMPGYPVTRIDTTAEKERVVQQFHGEGGGLIAVGLNSVWVSSPSGKDVMRFDPKRIQATLAE